MDMIVGTTFSFFFLNERTFSMFGKKDQTLWLFEAVNGKEIIQFGHRSVNLAIDNFACTF